MEYKWGIFINKELIDVFETLEEALINIDNEFLLDDEENLYEVEIKRIDEEEI